MIYVNSKPLYDIFSDMSTSFDLFSKPPNEAIVATTSPRNVNPSAQLKRLKALQPTDRVPAMDVDPSKRHRLVNVTWWPQKPYI